ncbi:hypothetical protein B0G75_13920 [Paraburkholderia sp. BL18I3N2]|uniref:hypothetical protein n=1 Tax=Paraburkholderia sp. BL18I3N2 TaxID=1938799 RepID=UPI000D05713F|nr:hypothetical protein [Paraburkholderia sp. BL18I3N2]PRX19157.1 hypothetical protein B0G75_13920 [Paraburkholderia sp. BL18I3N2]
MINTLQQAIANILFNKLMGYFDDLEGLSAVQNSKEYWILTELSKLLDQAEIPENIPTCVDYDIVIGAWNTLQSEVKALSARNGALLNMLTERFKLNTSDLFLLFGSLINHDTKIIQELDDEKRKAFKEYISEGNKIIREFKTTLLRYQTADLADNFFDESHIIDQKNIDYQSIDLNGTVIYLDQNAVARIKEDAQCTRQCLAGQASNQMAFVYSAYLVEDSINMNPLFLTDFISFLSLLTSNRMIAFIDREPRFVTEEIYQTVNRATKYSRLTKTFEKHRFTEVIQHYHDYPELRKGKQLYNELIKGPADFFRRVSKADIAGFDHVTRKFAGRQLLHDFIQTGSIRATFPQEKGELIEDLLDLLDFVNFETESVKLTNAGKICSSYRDNKHLTHACIADYFITDDKRLRARGNLIYSLIGVRTKFMDFKEFREHLPVLLDTQATGKAAVKHVDSSATRHAGCLDRNANH